MMSSVRYVNFTGLLVALGIAASYSPAARSSETCPSLAGEYVSTACRSGVAFETILIRQPDCRVIGFQTLSRNVTGEVYRFGPIRWQSVGSGTLMENEDSSYQYLRERYYERGSLYSYFVQVQKSDNQRVATRGEFISPVRERNLIVSYEGMTPGIWINLENCK